MIGLVDKIKIHLLLFFLSLFIFGLNNKISIIETGATTSKVYIIHPTYQKGQSKKEYWPNRLIVCFF